MAKCFLKVDMVDSHKKLNCGMKPNFIGKWEIVKCYEILTLQSLNQMLNTDNVTTFCENCSQWRCKQDKHGVSNSLEEYTRVYILGKYDSIVLKAASSS